MNKNTKENINTENVIRVDGGWWFSETTSEGRHVYEVLDRQVISPGRVLEFLKPLPEDFVQLPCWEQSSQLVQVHHKMNQEHLKSVADLQVLQWVPQELQWVPQELQVTSELPGQSLPQWVQEEVGPDSTLQKIMKSMISSQEGALSSSLTEKRITQVSRPQKNPEHVRQPSQQSQKVPSSSRQGNLKTGQLCPPTAVPEIQSSRVLSYQPSKPHKHSPQVDYKKCQIVMI